MTNPVLSLFCWLTLCLSTVLLFGKPGIAAETFLPAEGVQQYFQDCQVTQGTLNNCHHVVKYQVDGQNMKGICHQLDNMPGGSVGRTSGIFEITGVTMHDEGGHCNINSVTARSVVVIELPELSADSALNSKDLNQWLTFENRLSEHEFRHKAIFDKYHQSLWNELTTLKTYPGSCSEATQHIQGIYNDYSRRANEENMQYDKDTLNGIKEGVSLSC